MYKGFLELGGVEIVNAARVEAYVHNLMPQYPLRGCEGCDNVRLALGEAPYTSPLRDDASWVDPSNPATYDFLGAYPLDVQGIMDSTVESTVIQSITAGGYNGMARDATREIKVKLLLVATSQLGLDAGMTWLKEATRGSVCSDHGGTCTGSTLCYYAACPQFTACYDDANPTVGTRVNPATSPGSSPILGLPTANGELGDLSVSGTWATPSPVDGFAFIWGVAESGSLEDYLVNTPQIFGPVTPRRTNVVGDPRLSTVGTPLWTKTSATIAPHASGGFVDNGPYGTLTPTGTGKISTSIAAIPPGLARLAFDARAASASTLTVNLRLVSDNSLVATFGVSATTAWQRFQIALPFGSNCYLEFSTTVATDLGRIIAEGGVQQLPYFDGDTLPTNMPASNTGHALPEYAVSWTGTPRGSASRMVWLGSATYDYCGEGKFPWLAATSSSASVTNGATWYDAVGEVEQAAPYERSMHDVAVLTGPTVSQELATQAGASMIVDLVLSAATPFAYAATRDLIDGLLLSTLPKQTWVDLVEPAGPVTVVVDPNCPPIPDAPQPPAIVNECIDGPGTWDRYFYSIPAEEISVWSTVVPTIVLQSKTTDLRQLRLRLTPNPFLWPVVTGVRTDRTTNPALYNDATGWANLGGLGTGVRATTSGVDAAHPYSWKATANAAHAANLFGPSHGGVGINLVTAGKHYNIAGYLATSLAKTTARIKAEFYNAANALVGTAFFGTNTVTPASATTWTRASLLDVTAPATAVRVVVSGTFNAAATSTETVAMEMVSIREYDAAAPALAAYFDGYTTDANGYFYGWGSGTPGVGPSLGVQSAVDPFSYCAEAIVSYMPANAELTLDGTVERSFVSVGGAPAIPASNLLYGTDGAPLTWPDMTCGTPYLLTIDTPQGAGDGLELSLALTRRE